MKYHNGVRRDPLGKRFDFQTGFTLIELLVSLAVIGLLLALIVPAVQSSRESARRIQCTSHLKQIVLAAQNYASTYDVFPGSAGRGIGAWKKQLLPFLEQPADADIVSIYACPSDEYGSGSMQKEQVCYQANDGLWSIEGNGFARTDQPWQQTRPRDMTDGMTHTAAFAEKLAWPDIAPRNLPPDQYQEYWIRRIHTMKAYIVDMDEFAAACRQNPLPPGPGWMSIWGYNHIMTPNHNSCFNGPKAAPESSDYWAITATSAHLGGVNVSFSDGHVKFVSNQIETGVWRSLGSRNGGEVTTSDF